MEDSSDHIWNTDRHLSLQQSITLIRLQLSGTCLPPASLNGTITVEPEAGLDLTAGSNDAQ